MKRIPLWLGMGILAGCQPAAPGGWQQDLSALVDHGNAVLASVAALPECADLPSKAGTIRWLPSVWCGDVPAIGCTYPTARPPMVQVIPQTAWGMQNPDRSTLAHEFCHACGYTDEREAEACAQRSHAYFKLPALVATPSPAETGPAPDVTASLVEGAGRLAADAVRSGDRGHARELLQGALRAIAEPPVDEHR